MSYTQNKSGRPVKVNDKKKLIAPNWLSRWQFAVMRRMQQAAQRGKATQAPTVSDLA